MMNVRKIHRGLSWVIGGPLFVILFTGVLIQYKDQIPAMQPEKIPSTNLDTALQKNWSIESLVEIAKRQHPELVKVPEDIRVIDIRPNLGTARLRTSNYFEIQIDLSSGQILKTAPRYVGWMISLHEGALLGSGFRFGFWAPIGVLSLFLALSGFLLLVRKGRRRYE